VSNYVYTRDQQEIYHTYNEFDRHGLLLGLTRLYGEKNPEYKRRLLDVFVRRASSTYLGLIYGITRELGLELFNAIEVEPTIGHSMPNPAIVFQDTKCYLYSDYDEGTLVATLDRYSDTGGAFILSELVDSINATGQFTASLATGADPMARSMTIYNQSSVVLVPSEEISGGGSRLKLQNANLVVESVVLNSVNLTLRKASQVEVNYTGEYYIDHENGIIFTQTAPDDGATVRYAYRKDKLVAEASPVIIHDLQSEDFQTHMFESETTATPGLPTPVGADIINEIMTVHPGGWGK